MVLILVRFQDETFGASEKLTAHALEKLTIPAVSR